MYKAYTIKEYRCKEVSPGKGYIKYLLEDELGNQRAVSAMAKLGLIKKIKSVHAIHFRETPLIEALAKADINDTVIVDFSGFNKHHPRVASTQQRTLDTSIYKEIGDYNPASSDLNALSFDPIRLIQLFLIAIICFVVIMVIKSKLF